MLGLGVPSPCHSKFHLQGLARQTPTFLSLMSIPILPPSAPFNDDQRAWLNGFFAGLLGLDAPGNGAANNANSSALMPQSSTQLVEAAPAEDEDFPWHDPNLPIDERMQLADGKAFPRQLMAAMAQLDCGTCGYLCQTYAEAIASGADKDLKKCTPGGGETMKKLKQLVAEKPAGEPSLPALQPAQVERNQAAVVPANDKAEIVIPSYDKANPFPATVLEVAPLTRKDSAKDVQFVSLDLRGSGLEYEVGDALGVYPENCHDLVELLLERLEATGEEPVVTPEGTIVPCRIALGKAYVINTCNDEFLQTMSRLASDPTESSKLAELAQDDTENYLEGRDILDVLDDCGSVRTTSRSEIGELISSLSPLRPRLYSIASSLKAHPEQVHLTVGVVRYERAGCERVRKGVASTFLSERMRPGMRAGVFVQPSHGFRPPADSNTPMIMVGPGTGIAPFRAFLQERAATNATGKNWLFFGDQRQESDYLYQHELLEYSNSGLLTRLDTAFSRDQAEKIYVQHRMKEHGAELWQWLQDGAHFYVCGDARRMAKDVDAALQEVAREHGGMNEADAKSYVAKMAREGRYGRDVY